jgi:arylsulfatase A-like enzyme
MDKKGPTMAAQSSPHLDRPNLLFVFPDQLGATWLGCYGHPDVHTPNIDRFAREGLVFDRAYTASPVCTPFRGTLFTGRYPCQTGVIENGLRIPHSEVTLAQRLNQGGYHTSYVGKWHLSGPPGGNRWVPPQERAGFQDFIGWESHHVNHWQGLIWEDDPQAPIHMPGHETDALTDLACERLAMLSQPFCLFVSYQAPHPPCTPPPEFLRLYKDRELGLRPNVADRHLWYRRPEWNCDYSLRAFVERYYGEISHLDHTLGRLLSQVQALGLDQSTTVILTSDHGEMAGCHGLFGKGCMYEESVHIPLIVRHPQATAGRRTEALFSSIDFYPTLLDLCGLVPTGEGISYAPLILGKEQPPRERVFMQYKKLCIRRDTLKLVTDLSASTLTALYDLGADPYEQVNLLHDPAHQGHVNDLKEELDAWLQDALRRKGDTAQAVTPSPAFQPGAPA